MDVFQAQFQIIQTVSEIQEVDVPRTTGIVQMNTYYQNVLGPVQRFPGGVDAPASVSLVGHLAGYLGTSLATDTDVFPTSRAILDLHATETLPISGGVPEVRSREQGVAPLLPASSPVRQYAQEGQWTQLAGWRDAAPGGEVKSASARDLTLRSGLQGSSEHYRTAYPPMRLPGRRPCEAPPRVVNRPRSSFVDSSDYGWSADPRVACGERADDVAIKPVTDVLNGFSAPVSTPHWIRS